MSDPALALQGALVVAFKAGAGVGAAVYDITPVDAPFPRITVGEAQILGNYADCYDGSECLVQIDVWGRAQPDGTGLGFGPVKRVASTVRDIVNAAAFTLEGHTLELAQLRGTQYLRDPDGVTLRALMTARFLTQPQD